MKTVLIASVAWICFHLVGHGEETKRVLGIGGSYLDFLVQVDDHFLTEQLSIPKGGCCYCDSEAFDALVDSLSSNVVVMAGGSAANTTRALGKLGQPCAFLSSLGTDASSLSFLNTMQTSGVEGRFVVEGSGMSRTLCLITPDAERSFLACHIVQVEPTPSPHHFEGIDWVHIDGWRLRRKFDIVLAMQLAKERNARISLDLSSRDVVSEHKDFLLTLLPTYVDVVFCNEEEAFALTNLPPEQACFALQTLCPIAVVTCGSRGAFVGHAGTVLFVPAFTTTSIDSTGAGDFFSAGFLHAYLQGLPLETCALCGNYLAGHVIKVIGTQLTEETWEEARRFFAAAVHNASAQQPQENSLLPAGE